MVLACPLKTSPAFMRESLLARTHSGRAIHHGQEATHTGADHREAAGDRGSHEFGDDRRGGGSEARVVRVPLFR